MDIIEQLKRDEGVRLKPYKDSVGILTIGVGRNLDQVGISNAEADILLQNDVNFVEVEMKATWPWTLNLSVARFGALQNMAFNLGMQGLGKFKNFLAKMEASDWEGASADMLDSLWARQVGGRAMRLSEQIKTGEWK